MFHSQARSIRQEPHSCYWISYYRLDTPNQGCPEERLRTATSGGAQSHTYGGDRILEGKGTEPRLHLWTVKGCKGSQDGRDAREGQQQLLPFVQEYLQGCCRRYLPWSPYFFYLQIRMNLREVNFIHIFASIYYKYL